MSSEWKKKIVSAFAERALLSGHERSFLRIRAEKIFPRFDSAPPDERESFLEAAESLEKEGLLSLSWAKRQKGEKLLAASCRDIAALFRLLGSSPQGPVADVRQAAQEEVSFGTFRAEGSAAFLAWLSGHITAADYKHGADEKAVRDFAALCRAGHSRITARAFSVSLFSDSKRIETLARIFSPLAGRAERSGVPFPRLVLPERSFPETAAAGSLRFILENGAEIGGGMVGLPLETVKKIKEIECENKTVLTVENKETFYALCGNSAAENLPAYGCFLYTGGYPNRAASLLLSLLSRRGFSFFHAGDLDPDGILILQEIMRAAEKPVAPVKMDAEIFDRYLPWGRKLFPSMVKNLEKIKAETRALPGIAALILRIAETGRGIEQEIIDYR
jgi:hypothetical protein